MAMDTDTVMLFKKDAERVINSVLENLELTLPETATVDVDIFVRPNTMGQKSRQRVQIKVIL